MYVVHAHNSRFFSFQLIIHLPLRDIEGERGEKEGARDRLRRRNSHLISNKIISIYLILMLDVGLILIYWNTNIAKRNQSLVQFIIDEIKLWLPFPPLSVSSLASIDWNSVLIFFLHRMQQKLPVVTVWMCASSTARTMRDDTTWLAVKVCRHKTGLLVAGWDEGRDAHITTQLEHFIQWESSRLIYSRFRHWNARCCHRYCVWYTIHPDQTTDYRTSRHISPHHTDGKSFQLHASYLWYFHSVFSFCF